MNLGKIYRSYIATVNEQQLHRLHEFVAVELMVNGKTTSLTRYMEAIDSVFASFPDYRWEILRSATENNLISVVLRDTGRHDGADWLGIPARGQLVETIELAMYRIEDGKIVEVLSVADNERIRQQLDPGGTGST